MATRMEEGALDSLNWSICTDEAEDVLSVRAEMEEEEENQGMQLRCARPIHSMRPHQVAVAHLCGGNGSRGVWWPSLTRCVWWPSHAARGRSSDRTLLARRRVGSCAA